MLSAFGSPWAAAHFAAALAFKAAKSHFDHCIALNRVDSTVPSICDMIVPTPVVPRARADAEPHHAVVVEPPARPHVDVPLKPDPQQIRKKRCGNRLDEPPDQHMKNRGMFHLVNPNNRDPFVNLLDANPDFVCQGRYSKKYANGDSPKNGVNYFGPHKMPLIMIRTIGDTFLSDKSGWFDRHTFESFDLACRELGPPTVPGSIRPFGWGRPGIVDVYEDMCSHQLHFSTTTKAATKRLQLALFFTDVSVRTAKVMDVKIKLQAVCYKRVMDEPYPDELAFTIRSES